MHSETCRFLLLETNVGKHFTATYCVMFSCKFDSIQMSWNTQITVHTQNSPEKNISWCIFPAVVFGECFCLAMTALAIAARQSTVAVDIHHTHIYTCHTQCHSNTFSQIHWIFGCVSIYDH